MLLPLLVLNLDVAVPVVTPPLWVTQQDTTDGWVAHNSASADIAVWGVVWGASWGTSAPWSTVNNVSDAWVKIQ